MIQTGETTRLHLGKSGMLDIEFIEGEELDRIEQLAREALQESRKSLMMAVRFLNAAIWHLPPERTLLAHPIATNGRVLRFDPIRVVDRYSADDNELVRDYLHTVLHCVFHHPFEKSQSEYAAWSLASDIAVELCALDFVGNRFPSALDGKRRAVRDQLERLAGSLTAPALYQLFRCGAPGEALYASHGFTDRDLSELAALFKRDAHDLWASHPRDDSLTPEHRSTAQPLPDLQEEQMRPSAARGNEEKQDTMPDECNAESVAQDEIADEEAAADWNKISKRVEAELRAQRQSYNEGGGLLQNLTVANRKPANYDEFLRRFATVAEDMRVSDDEFDYVYYTYGLSHYGNVPLVEPLEYQESKRVREFVIALDTSGSCAGELIRTFVERTYAILRQQTSFGHDINVHIVQCDMRVRTATKVTSLAQLESYADSFWVSGGGGTDFRPVFDYVDELVDAGEFNDLRGLIFFTDGYGTFPARPPAYDVAFVFVDTQDTNVKVPSWAMKVTMTQEEVLQR